MRVRVSAKWARVKFHPCTLDFILNVCKSRCETSCKNQPIDVFVDDSEIERIEMFGAKVKDNLLVPTEDGRCPFQQKTNALCKIHVSGLKPFGCAASPFSLNSKGTLVIRHRNLMLPCHKADGALPAYISYRDSLDGIFGLEEAERICKHLDAGGGDFWAEMSDDMFRLLAKKEAVLNRQAGRYRDDLSKLVIHKQEVLDI